MFKFEWVLASLCFSIGSTSCQNFIGDHFNSCHLGVPGEKFAATTLPDIRGSRGFQKFNESFRQLVRNGERHAIDLTLWNDFPVLPIVFGNSLNFLPDGKCKEQVRRYLDDLGKSKIWAVQMFDASTKYPDGVYFGHTKHLGNFDQCYNLKAKLPPDEYHDNEDEIEGRYCLIRFRYQRKNFVVTAPEFFTVDDFDPNISAWDAIDDRGDFRRVKRNSVYMAVCVPASCSAEEVRIGMAESLKEFADARGVRLETRLKPSLSQARSDIPDGASTGTKVFCLIIASLFVLVVGSSWYDGTLGSADDAAVKNGPLGEFFLCFSARRNLQSIFAPAGSHRGLECIHLIRVLFMICVIVGHRTMQYYGYPVANSIYLEKAYGISASTMLFHGPIIVDGFLGLGGLLLAYGLMKELDRNKRTSFAMLIAVRFLRLTPLYMTVVFFHATLMPLMGSGPYWEDKVGSESEHCAKNWWTNVLYVNNYVNSKEICMFQSWYLSVDYHLHIMGLFVLWTFRKLPKRFGYPFIGVLIAIGVGIPIFVTYTQNLQPIFLGLPFMSNVRRDPYFVDHYIKTHMRIGPYMVGMLAGIIIYDHEGSTWRLSKTWSRVLVVVFPVGVSIFSQSLSSKYFDPNSVLRPLESAVYSGLNKAAFTLGICSIPVLITIGDGLDFHHNFMTPRWAPPLARLAYGAFLVHNINQSYDIGVTRAPRIFSIHNMMWDLVPDVVYTFALSLLLSVGVEGPIRKFERYLFTERSANQMSPERSSSNQIERTKQS